MIFIDRFRRDESGTQIQPSQHWFHLAEEATQRAIHEDGAHAAEEDIYRSTEVRAALEKLFFDKCAYCEGGIENQDWEVEHFRPKGRVAERVDHPGYYWLTYEWRNLYPSCPHCNKRRKDKPRWGDLRYATTGGKWDQFPLEDEGSRAMTHRQDIELETSLLIDPCGDDPEQYLNYDVKGQIYPRGTDRKAEVTIEVCHLKRRRLRDGRLGIINLTVELLKLIRKVERQRKVPVANDMRSWLQEHILCDAYTYTGAARAVYRDPDAFGVQ